jgi:cytochrome bd-type quinol oxidase subunit 2
VYHHWKQTYGVPFDLFVELSNTFEVMACFRQLHLRGPLSQHREGYGLQTTLFRNFHITVWLALRHQGWLHQNANNQSMCSALWDIPVVLVVLTVSIFIGGSARGHCRYTVRTRRRAPQLWCLKCWPVIPQRCCMWLTCVGGVARILSLFSLTRLYNGWKIIYPILRIAWYGW